MGYWVGNVSNGDHKKICVLRTYYECTPYAPQQGHIDFSFLALRGMLAFLLQYHCGRCPTNLETADLDRGGVTGA